MEYGSERPQDETRRKAEQDAERLKKDAGQIKREGMDAARRQAEGGKERAARELDSLSDAVDKAASALSEEDKQGLANYLRQASEQMSSLSSRLHERSIDELTEDVKRLARRNPAAFMLGSVALGFGLSRFLKAASPESRWEQEDLSRYSERLPADTGYGTAAARGMTGDARPAASPSPGASSYRSPPAPGATPGATPGSTPGGDIHH